MRDIQGLYGFGECPRKCLFRNFHECLCGHADQVSYPVSTTAIILFTGCWGVAGS